MHTCLVAIAALFAVHVASFGINIDAHEEACFQEDVTDGTKLGG